MPRFAQRKDFKSVQIVRGEILVLREQIIFGIHFYNQTVRITYRIIPDSLTMVKWFLHQFPNERMQSHTDIFERTFLTPYHKLTLMTAQFARSLPE